MKRNIIFVIGIVILIATIWFITTIGLNYNKRTDIAINPVIYSIVYPINNISFKI